MRRSMTSLYGVRNNLGKGSAVPFLGLSGPRHISGHTGHAIQPSTRCRVATVRQSPVPFDWRTESAENHGIIGRVTAPPWGPHEAVHTPEGPGAAADGLKAASPCLSWGWTASC